MKLKEIDLKLLNYLYHNYDEPISKIAKNTKITRDQVEYRLNKYTQTGLIKQFIPIINYKAIGYNKQVIFFLKFETSHEAKEYYKELKNNPNISSYGEILEKYDVYTNAIFKNNKEINQFITKLFENKNYKLKEYNIVEPYFAELYPLKLFNNKEKENYELTKQQETETKIDELDLRILKELSKNGRIKLIDLSNKLKNKSTTILYRLKKLKKEKIILGNRIQFNSELLRYNYTALLINFSNKSKETEQKIKQFARSSKNINSLLLNLHKPNCIIQFFYKEENEIREEIQQLKKIFENEEIEIELIHLNEEEHINTTPFL